MFSRDGRPTGAGLSRRIARSVSIAGLLTLLVVASSRAQAQPMVAAELHQKAFQQGSVRVMVEFEAPYVPEAHLPTAAHILAQRQSIAAARLALSQGRDGIPLPRRDRNISEPDEP